MTAAASVVLALLLLAAVALFALGYRPTPQRTGPAPHSRRAPAEPRTGQIDAAEIRRRLDAGTLPSRLDFESLRKPSRGTPGSPADLPEEPSR